MSLSQLLGPASCSGSPYFLFLGESRTHSSWSRWGRGVQGEESWEAEQSVEMKQNLSGVGGWGAHHVSRWGFHAFPAPFHVVPRTFFLVFRSEWRGENSFYKSTSWNLEATSWLDGKQVSVSRSFHPFHHNYPTSWGLFFSLCLWMVGLAPPPVGHPGAWGLVHATLWLLSRQSGWFRGPAFSWLPCGSRVSTVTWLFSQLLNPDWLPWWLRWWRISV